MGMNPASGIRLVLILVTGLGVLLWVWFSTGTTPTIGGVLSSAVLQHLLILLPLTIIGWAWLSLGFADCMWVGAYLRGREWWWHR